MPGGGAQAGQQLSSDTMPTLRVSHDGQLQAEREQAAGH